MRTRRQLGVLDTLIAQGIDLATRLHQQSTTRSDLYNARAAFAQINQSICRAILVSRKLAEPLLPARPAPAKSRP